MGDARAAGYISATSIPCGRLDRGKMVRVLEAAGLQVLSTNISTGLDFLLAGEERWNNDKAPYPRYQRRHDGIFLSSGKIRFRRTMGSRRKPVTVPQSRIVSLPEFRAL
jgi:hypothetical protein